MIKYFGLIYLCMFFLFLSCKQNRDAAEKYYDTPKYGEIKISVDESFQPVIVEQLKMYKATFPESNIIASYKSEAECLKDLENDSVRVVLVAKGLTDDQADYLKKKLEFRPQYDVVAYDAVTVIVNENSNDSVFTISKLRKILSGELNKNVVLDGNNATSTVRYLQDSILLGADFGKNVMAAKNSRDLVEYISKNNDAIGFVGSSWVMNIEDAEQKEFDKYIKAALVECKNCDKDTFAKPSPSTISYGYYPLVRPLYFILKENTTGLGTGFINFLSLERGQLIFRRSYLVPAKMSFLIRKTEIDEQ